MPIGANNSLVWYPITSRKQLSSFREEHPRSVVFFTAPWCFRCKTLAPKFSGFPADFPSINFYSLDLDEVEEVGDELIISTLPTFILYLHGKEVHRIEGVPQQRPARLLAKAISQFLLAERD
ncbi:hypothetical protein Ndes2526B_g09228 [Nannochloris sp. 'desiccata']